MEKDNFVLNGLDKELLLEFAETFLGYGNLKSQVWFIGMEPGAPRDIIKLGKFFKGWAKRGKLPIDDVKASYLEIDDPHYRDLFKSDAKYQRTWGPLIKLLKYYNGEKEVTTESVKSFQINKLGGLHSDHCLLEILPLPSPDNTAKSWEDFYGHCFGTRKEYEKEYLKKRKTLIRNLILTHKPKLVVFYGLKYKTTFAEIVDNDFNSRLSSESKVIRYTENGFTKYLLIRQPSQGVSDKYLAEAAQFIKTFK